MSLGSAASLPGTMPQAPLFPTPVTRRATVVPHNWGDAAAPRMAPLQKAAENPPRGYVLLAEGDHSATSP